MSAATIQVPSAAQRASSITRTRQLRPGRGGGRTTGPVSRSTGGVAAPELGRGRQLRVDAHSCRADYRRPTAITSAGAECICAGAVSTGWRLTNRGIALVLIAGAVLVAAALTVITATAVTVTSGDYHPHGSVLADR